MISWGPFFLSRSQRVWDDVRCTSPVRSPRLLHLCREPSTIQESNQWQEVIFGRRELSHRRRLWWMDLLHELRPLHSRLPPLWPAFRFVDLHHKERQNHHGPKKSKDWNSLSHVLVVPPGHYTWRGKEVCGHTSHNQITFQTGRLTTADQLAEVRQDAN